MTKHIEEKAENLCRLDNHISGNSGNSNKYAIKKSSVRKALTTLSIKIHEEAIKELEQIFLNRENELKEELDKWEEEHGIADASTFTRIYEARKNRDEAITYHKGEIKRLTK